MHGRSGPQHPAQRLDPTSAVRLKERERDSGPNSTYLGHKGLESTSILRAQVGLGSRPGAVVLRARGRARPGARAVVAGPDSCFLGSFHAYIATYVSCHTYLRLALRTCSASPQIRNPPPPGAPRSGVPLRTGTKKRSGVTRVRKDQSRISPLSRRDALGSARTWYG